MPIDLIAHSQGGVVARLALIELERRHGDALARAASGMFATLGSPHGGADLATARPRAGRAPSTGGEVLDAVRAPRPTRSSTTTPPSIAQLGETSDVVAELAAHPVPDTIHAVSIAARGDLVVPVPAEPGARDGRGGRAAHGPRAPTATCPAARGHPGAGPGPGRAPAGLPDASGRPCSTRAWGRGSASLEDLVGAGGFLVAARADVRGA